MVIRFDGNFLLLFYIFADYFVFSLKIISFRIVTVLSVGLGLFVSILNYSLEFVSLKFIELSSWQGITIDEDTHQFLVIRNGEIVRLDYFLLESSLYLTVSERNSPCLLRNYDGAKHISILHDSSFLYFIIIFLQFEFYLIRLNIFSI